MFSLKADVEFTAEEVAGQILFEGEFIRENGVVIGLQRIIEKSSI